MRAISHTCDCAVLLHADCHVAEDGTGRNEWDQAYNGSSLAVNVYCLFKLPIVCLFYADSWDVAMLLPLLSVVDLLCVLCL